MSSTSVFPTLPCPLNNLRASSIPSDGSAPYERSRRKSPRALTALASELGGDTFFLAVLANSIHAAWMDGDATIPSYVRPKYSLGYSIEAASYNLCHSLEQLSRKFGNYTLSPILTKAMAILDSDEGMAKLPLEAKERLFRETASHTYHLTLRLCQVFWMAEGRCGSEHPGLKPAEAARAIVADLNAQVEEILSAGAAYLG